MSNPSEYFLKLLSQSYNKSINDIIVLMKLERKEWEAEQLINQFLKFPNIATKFRSSFITAAITRILEEEAAKAKLLSVFPNLNTTQLDTLYEIINTCCHCKQQ